ncbi:hypothetical protein RN001_016413 [Aquatica leii]|uniref:Aldehyde oxidase n=1 Tax=Aquatica leii TaxID=1421715 RepID=A0AAN7NXW7_9COLE|nr:hypothetical protein RN001_016413 [Aquatica leii]
MATEEKNHSEFQQSRQLKFFVKDEEHTVETEDLPPETTLNQYLREKLNLTGTKYMCLEGGCGACVVAVTLTNPITNRNVTVSVNSCLVPISICSGWKIHTVESIGNEHAGYHATQKALVQFSGTQCGFCSSGMVMNMFALYETNDFTMADVDNAFGGNICRCTGYRPILSAFKSLAKDASSEYLGTYTDIEDIPLCSKSNEKCSSTCLRKCKQNNQPHYYNYLKSRWYKVYNITEILTVLEQNPKSSYMLISGNTAKGVYHTSKVVKLYIDITSAKELLEHTLDESHLTLGANITLTNTIKLFKKISKKHLNFSYLKKLADHIDLIASTPVRNIGTLAGNLYTKHEHHEFPSDIFVIFETVGAQLNLIDINQKEVTISLVDFLTYKMKGVVIKSIVLPALDDTFKLETFKIMPRAQNAHALVNAGFLFKLNLDNTIESGSLVYGAINPSFAHASNAEQYLKGKNLFDNNTLKGLFEILHAEITPDHVLPDPSPEFRQKLAIALCYKFILSIAPDNKLIPRNKSGGFKFSRPVSKGTQDYETNESLYPLTQPIPKIEALGQCTGKAQYIMDMPDRPNQLYAAFVLAKAAPHSIIKNVDPQEALKVEGVVAFYDKNDIPGENSFTPLEEIMFSVPEEIFCSGVVKYYYQPLGIVVAKTQESAEKSANLVHVTYTSGTQKPLCTIREILNEKGVNGVTFERSHTATHKGDDVKHVIKGKLDAGPQYHYSMETQCCFVIPDEDGLTLFPATQCTSMVQTAVAKALNLPLNKLNISVRRLGGAYGSKISRSGLTACAASLAAYKLQKPVKMWLPFTTNMNVIGKRCPVSMDYEVQVDEKGCIQMLDASIYTDMGSFGGNENLSKEILHFFLYDFNNDTWNVKMYSAKTDTPTNTWCRAPGTTEGIVTAMSIMNHISSSLNIDVIQIYKANFDNKQPNLSKYLDDLVEWAEIDKRRESIKEFNEANRWIKKGMGIVPLGYPQVLFGNWNVFISVYQADGTVALTHGGVEMGQGINTKVAQVCAYALGIPLDHIEIKPTNVAISPNLFPTGGSLTSEAVCYATLKACGRLKERMEPVKQKMDNPNWLELVRACFLAGVDLTTYAYFNPTAPDVHTYTTYGSTCVEVEVDILTGLCQIIRVDLIEDTGNSMSPYVDIGQVEGAFTMGMGYWTTEEIVFGSNGELLTNRTWNYKPPGAKDIPIDFRVKFPRNNPNPLGVLNSKATGEPPLCMTCAVPFAIRDAVASARMEVDSTINKWYPLDGPSTVANTLMSCLHNHTQYNL